MKVYVVSVDEKEYGVCVFLNFGYIFGYGFEVFCGYGDRLLYGEVIVIGMVFVFEFFEEFGFCEKGLF